LHLHSPGAAANLQRNSNVEMSIAGPISRKKFVSQAAAGFRFPDGEYKRIPSWVADFF
jgi:hypothetical protein